MRQFSPPNPLCIFSPSLMSQRNKQPKATRDVEEDPGTM